MRDRSNAARAYERSVARDDRAARGVFYTPDAVADVVAEAAIALWLEAHWGVPFEVARERLRVRAPSAELQAMRGLTIVDPSCGAGALLAAAGRAVQGVAVRLVGGDVDGDALALARERLPAETELVLGDALDPGGPRGDIVLTNPPYGGIGGASPDVDRYVTFWRSAVARVKQGGVLAVLAPTSWRTGQRYWRARRDVIEPAGVRRVLELPRGVFADAYVDACVALCRPRGGRPGTGAGANTCTPTRTRTVTFTTPTLGNLFDSARGILAPPRLRARGARLLLGPVAPFVWPTRPAAFGCIAPGDVLEGRRALTFGEGPRLLVRRIVGRAWRLQCVVAREPAIAKKDFYVLRPREAGLSLEAYAALLHARSVAERLAERDVAAAKGDFAQLTLGALRELRLPRLPVPNASDRTRASRVSDAAMDLRDLPLVSAWLEARAAEAEEIGWGLLAARVRRIDCDPAWDGLRSRLDPVVARLLA